jgi:hypothetical protein
MRLKLRLSPRADGGLERVENVDHANMARGRRFPISSRSRASSLGFAAAVNASAKNAALNADQPASSSPLPPARRERPVGPDAKVPPGR